MKKVAKHQKKIIQLQKDCKKENINFIQSNILQELSIEEKYPQAEFLTNDDIVTTDLNGCHITNLKTTERTTLNKAAFTTLIVRPNKEKFAIYLGNTIKIYDSITKEKQKTFRSETPIHIALFNPTKETIILCDNNNLLTHYNYTTNESCPITLHAECPPILSIAMHPTNNQMILGERNGCASLNILHSDLATKTIKIIIFENHYRGRQSIVYSPNGSLVATYNGLSLYNVSDEKFLIYRFRSILNKEQFRAIASHPNNSIIAGLSTPSNCIAYIDTNKEHCICIMSPLFGGENTHSSHVFSFSPDGTKLMIAVYNKLFIVEVPFEVFYQDDTKEKLPYLLFLLNNINNSSPVFLPEEIITILKQNQLNVFKR